MKKTVITGENVPASDLPFSPALKVGEWVFVSGQASVDEEGKIVVDTFAGECRRSFENVKKVLAGAGLTLDDVVQVRNFVGSEAYLKEFNEIYREYFNPPYPARTTIMNCLGQLLKFEVEVIAMDKSEKG
ncbi:RidA family protein [Membranihabitans marinus]|uniref:RidA family protein n=1 Tax=Membranihabitans marinus TaxID=1227546 RepID=UPI001F41479D|nr:RidA family protein [Membranihabitans marinus]